MIGVPSDAARPGNTGKIPVVIPKYASAKQTSGVTKNGIARVKFITNGVAKITGSFIPQAFGMIDNFPSVLY